MDLRSWFAFKDVAESDPKQYRTTITALIGLVVLMGVSGVLAFFLVLRGEERTLVPEVSGLELTAALVKMQEKDLYPRISLRVSDNGEPRGTVLEQEPKAGAIVKAGRRITLVVSRGPLIDKVGDYVGQNIDEVKIHLQTVFGAAKQLVVIKDPVVYIYDKNPVGTILQQNPPPGADVAGLVHLELVVSRGPEKAKVKVPALLGLSLEEATAPLQSSDIAFKFTARPAEGREKAGSIVAQLPVAGTMELPTNPVALVYTFPPEKAGYVSGLFSQSLPAYPYPLKVTLFAESASGSRTQLVSVNHPGTLFTFPYTLPEDSVLVLQVLNKVVARQEVRKK